MLVNANRMRDPARARSIPQKKRMFALPSLDRFAGITNAKSIDFDSSAKLWKPVLEQCTNRDRALLALELFANELDHFDRAHALDAAVLVWAAATTKDGGDTEGLVPPVLGILALKKLASPEGAALKPFLDRAESIAERAVLLKQIGGSFTDSAEKLIAELEELAPLIRGKSWPWLLDHTTAYGIARAPGVQQVFAMSCGPAIRLLEEAENQPLLALKVELDPLGMFDERSFCAIDQKTRLEGAGGSAVPLRDVLAGIATDLGTGSDLQSYIETALEGTGMKYDRVVWSLLDANERLELLGIFEFRVKAGLDIPALTGVDGRVDGHYEAIVDCSVKSGHRVWRVHNPLTGRSRWVRDRALLDGPFDSKTGSVLRSAYIPT